MFPLYFNDNEYHVLSVTMFLPENWDHVEVGPSPPPTCWVQGSVGKMVTWLTPRGSLGIHQIEDELNPFHMEELLYRHMKTQLSAELGDSTSYYFLKTSCLHWKWTDSRLKKSAVARCAWVFFHSLFINLFLNILRNWVVINIVSVQSLSHVQLFTTSWTAERQTSLSFTNSWSLLKLMSI